MAIHMTKAELAALPIASYASLRDDLRSGFLLFASGEYLVSKAIQHFTESPWSHVGILLVIPAIDRVLLLESVEDMGVRLAPLSKYLTDYEDGRPYRGALAVARPRGLTAAMAQTLTSFGIDELTRPYDPDEIGKIVARIALGRGKRERDREYICSELVYECFSRAGYEFTYDGRGFISPENIWTDTDVELVARFR